MTRVTARTSLLLASTVALSGLLYFGLPWNNALGQASVRQQLIEELRRAGFTGQINQSLERRLGRPINKEVEQLGRLIFFDKIQGLHGDNSCAGCHAPAAGYGDFESIAIGVDNNDIVGPNRKGPRNQRRTPMVLNNAFYPKLMWNGRFFAPSGDPFDNSQGFAFPDPEGVNKFPANDPDVKFLLAAQGHIPGTELPEMAGFTGISGTLFATQRFFAGTSGRSPGITIQSVGASRPSFQQFSAGGAQVLTAETNDNPDFAQFDDGHGIALPPPEADGTRNEPIRAILERRINDIPAYRDLFAKNYPDVAAGKPIRFSMIAQALSEFQIGLTFADAPIDRFARGDHGAMSEQQQRGALLFFGKANCVSCHATANQSNEMFSDFQMRNIGVPQIAPKFGKGTGNVPFRNSSGEFKASGNYDFGLADVTPAPNEADRFKFRTSPLRNIHLQPTFFHNGSFTRLEDAIRHHLDPQTSARSYDPAKAGVDEDLRTNTAPIEPVLATLDPLVQRRTALSDQEFADVVAFVRHGLADPRATPENLMLPKPSSVPSGLPLQTFEMPTTAPR